MTPFICHGALSRAGGCTNKEGRRPAVRNDKAAWADWYAREFSILLT